MQTPEVVALYTFKASANQHLKNKQFSQASVYYADILTKFEEALEKLETEEDVEKIIKEIKIPCHKNLSLCYLKMDQNLSCIKQCEEVLKIEPNCLKTIYRVSKAYMSLEAYDQAEKYLKRGFAIDPNQQQIQKALSEIQAAKNPVKTTSQPSFFSLKNLIALVLYYPLLIFNFFLSLIFGGKKQPEEKRKSG